MRLLPLVPSPDQSPHPRNEERVINIGELAERTGLPSKTIRYYEETRLVMPELVGNG
jgi:predicted DNA-binding transcriptional regulator AlpA